jgi:hypothetical protein
LSWSRAGINGLLLSSLFIIQESAISKIQFPIATFSFYLCALLGLMALEDRFGAIALGFIGGIIQDLSPSTDSPLGKWALILTIVGFLFSRNRESIGDFTERPLAFVLFVTVGVSFTLIIFLLLGIILGENNGNMAVNFQIIFGNALWILLFSPILLPGLAKFRSFTLASSDHR